MSSRPKFLGARIRNLLHNASTMQSPLERASQCQHTHHIYQRSFIELQQPYAVGWRKSTADHEDEGSTFMHMQQDQTHPQQDHLLLRPPAAAAAAATITQPSDYAELPELPSAAHASSSRGLPARGAQGLQPSSSWAKPRVTRTPKATQDDQIPGPAAASSSHNARKALSLRLLRVLDLPITTWVLMMMTLFVIFQEDFKYAALPPSADIGFEAVTLALLLLFFVEIGELPTGFIAVATPHCAL